ncbi:hypothetical protein CMUS01_12126 [Colletotrichum musicola]|uniref:Microtubule associated protein n=1 Tax=Colletotrichum musicola TaxID=2175873 RepID=A0A8H6JQZ8_9PEZI|nr:hypothetical protein CMUS01_12126 [Colletotrichum musicola]
MSEPTKAASFIAKMGRVHEYFGFQKKYNFVLFVNFAGALMGFTLARLMYLNVDNVLCGPGFGVTQRALPGECYYYRNFEADRIGIIMHLACILPASFLVFWQFIPAVRRRFVLFHRINGYIILALSISGTVGALLIARHAVGGGLEVQASLGFLSISFLGSLVFAFVQIKRLQIEQHRAWMLRAWFYAGAIITMRPILLIGALIASKQGGYFASLPCAVIEHMLGNAGAANATAKLFEACAPYLAGSSPNQQVLVEADFFDRSTPAGPAASLHVSFGMAGWVAGAIHAVGVEVYGSIPSSGKVFGADRLQQLRLTPREAERLRQVSYQRQLRAGMRNPGSAGFTADKLGDADKWEPKAPGMGEEVRETGQVPSRRCEGSMPPKEDV